MDLETYKEIRRDHQIIGVITKELREIYSNLKEISDENAWEQDELTEKIQDQTNRIVYLISILDHVCEF